MKKKQPKLFFRCECAPKKWQSPKCCSLEVIDMGDGDAEVEGAFLKNKSVKKLIKFLIAIDKQSKH